MERVKRPRKPPDVQVLRPVDANQPITVRDRRLDDDELAARRRAVLAGWPTGREVDLDEAVAYHLRLPAAKSYARKVRWAKEHGLTLVQPRGGFALVEEQIALLRCLQDEGGADLLPVTTDSYTRNERWQDAQRGLEESRRIGRSVLNGLPVVNHGPREVRRLVEAVDHPLIALTGTARPCLTGEVVFAAGLSAYLGSPIAYTMSYTKETSLQQGIESYQYLDRLAAAYVERGVPIHREQPGFLTGTLEPPGLAVAISALDMLLALRQGVRHYSPGIGQNLCFTQDVAALLALETICQDYARRRGYQDVFTPTVSDQWMGAFPPDEPRASAVIALGAVIARCGGATQVVTKSPQEAIGIPTKEANAAGARVTKTVLALLEGTPLGTSPDVQVEQRMIEAEARAIVDRTLELGDGDVAVGVVRAFRAGVLDVPWSPNLENANQVVPVRDGRGAVRYLLSGNVPLPPEVREYQAALLAERGRAEGREPTLDWALADVSAVTRGVLLGTGQRWEDAWRAASPGQATYG